MSGICPCSYRCSFQDWLLWGLFSADRNNLDPDWEEELEEYVGHLEGVIGVPLEDGYNPAVRVQNHQSNAPD